jgi:glycosyltransferase involved in cell wall biosynthesis
MKLLLVPSWYPWPGDPLRGIFLREQAVAIGRSRPDWEIAVAVWGQRRYTLSLRHPLRSAAVLADFLLSVFRARKFFLLPNVREYRRPALEWSKKWRWGNIKGQERACRKILKKARRDLGRLDLIHAHVAFPGGWIAMRLSQRFRLPYVVSEHMGDFPFKEFRNADGTLNEVVREPLRRAQALVAVSPVQAERIASWGFPDPRVIPNMIDSEFFRPAADLKKAGGTFVFFALSAFKPAKGLVDLLQALVLLLRPAEGQAGPDIQLRIGGEGEMERELRSLARQLAIEPWVHWLGRLDRQHVLEEYRGCDCFVQPSHVESFSLVVLEALACGKPVIATRCGGPEFLVTPENGMLVARQDPSELALAMRSMVSLSRAYDASVIRRQFMERFSMKIIMRQMEGLYGDVLKISQPARNSDEG